MRAVNTHCPHALSGRKQGENMAELKRTLGVWGAANVSIGAIIGTGIFVLIGVASGLAGPAVILSFVIAGIVVFLTALSAAELASFIHEAGGSYIFTTKAFGQFFGFIVGWMQSFDYIIGASAVAIGFAAYFTYFVGIPTSTENLIVIGCILPLVLTLVNLKGLKEAAGANNLLVALKIVALVIFVAIGGYFIFSHGDYANYQPFLPTGIRGVLSGTAIIFFAYVGVNTVTTMAEEVKDPGRTLPRAILIAMAVTTALYIGVSAVAVGLVNWKILGPSSAPIEAALVVATSNFLVIKYVALSALFATTSVVLSSIFGGSRMLFAMARQKVIPERFARISGNGVPIYTVIISGIVMSLIVIASRANLDWLASIFNFGTLLTYSFINLSVIELRKTASGAPRPFRVPGYPLTPILGVVSCILLSFYLNVNAIIAAGAWIGIGIFLYTIHENRSSASPPESGAPGAGG
jgi:APA family basic amino acid/polyamine antiporter